MFLKTLIKTSITNFHHSFSYRQWHCLHKISRRNNQIHFNLSCNYCDIKTNEDLLFTKSQETTIPSVLKIKRTIKSAGTYEIHDGFSCIESKCPACDFRPTLKSSTGNDGCVSNPICINKTTGDVVCSKCQYIFSFSAIEKFYTRTQKNQVDLQKQHDLFIKSKPPVQLYTPENIDAHAIPVDDLDPEQRDEIYTSLDLGEIFTSSIDGLGLLYNFNENILYFPMHDVDNRIVGFKALSRRNKRIIEETVPDTRSWGMVMVPPVSKRGQKESKAAILVLNVLDVLALRTQNISSTIICLPHGFKSLPQECLPVLEKFQKLILWFDYNSVGWDIAKNFAKKLDEKRCHFVRPIEDQPTPYNAITQSINIKSILLNAKPILHKAITTFKGLRQDVLSDLQNIDKVQGIKWKRFPVLNKYLKGHRRGELTILTGPTGCGKTTFMSEYSLDLAMQGVSTLWGSFEIRNSRLALTLLQQLSGKPLEEHIDEFEYWADEFEKLPMFFMTFHGQQALRIVMEAIEHAQYVHDVHHVIIDNLQFMMGTMEETRHMDRFWRQDEIIAAFRTFATKKNCHVTLVIHPRKERNDDDLTTSSIFGSAKATQEADNVLIIQDKRLTSVKGKKYLQVAKNRYSGDLGIMILDFDKDGLSYASKKKNN